MDKELEIREAAETLLRIWYAKDGKAEDFQKIARVLHELTGRPQFLGTHVYEMKNLAEGYLK